MALLNDAGLPGITAAQLAEINRLRSSNELYQIYLPQWQFFMAAYEGGKDFAETSDNIHRHPREHVDDYKERIKRAHYLNYCEPLVDFFTAFIFAETIQRNGGTNADFYNDFIKDVNRKGEDVTTFMQQGSDDKQIFGMVYILVDAPKVDAAETISKAQAAQMNLRPYWVLIRPEEVLDWVSDEFDKYTYWKRRQDIVQGGMSKRVLERYYEWTPDKITMTDIDVTNPNKPILMAPVITVNSIGEVPVVLMRYKRSKRYRFMGQSFLVDLAYNNREVMNLTSLLQEFLYRQAFNILAMQTDSTLPTANQSEGDTGTANLLQYPKGAEAPSYIAPSADPAKFIQEERQRIISEMYKRAAQDTVNELFNGSKASGFSKSQSFSTAVPKIATRADILEKAENRLMELTMKYMDKKWDGKIKYKDRYELTNISDALSQMTSLFKDLQMPSETFVKQELKRMVHEFDGKIPLDEMNKIEAEIDSMDFQEWQTRQFLALVGSSGQAQDTSESSGSTTESSNAHKQKAPTAGIKPLRKPSTSTELRSESTKK